MNMKKFLTLLLVAIATTTATAQFNFGLKAGVNLAEKPTLNIEELKSNLKGNAGWFVGPTAKFVIPVIGLGLEANALYSQANVDIDGQNILTQSIEIPVYLRYEITIPAVNKFIEPFIAVGPQFGWNIGNKTITLDNIEDVAGELIKREYKMKDSNVSLNLGLGFIFFDHLQIHGNYNLALKNTADIKSIRDLAEQVTSEMKSEVKTNVWQISLAYIF